jgi:DNA-binding ferritin-like protein
MISTTYPQLLLVFSALACVFVAGIAWILAWRSKKTADEMAEYARGLHEFVEKQLSQLPSASWRADIDSGIGELRDAVASLGGSVRKINARAAAKARYEKENRDPDTVDLVSGLSDNESKDALRARARKQGLLK